MAKMAYFYGWNHEEIMALDAHVFQSYWLAIDRIEAQEMLLGMTLQDFPNMKKDARSKLHRKLHKAAYPNNEEKKKITPQQLEAMING